MANFEEMDTINPVMDLVVFRHIKDIEMGIMKSLPVSYDLGLNFHPHLNDWVGLFYSGWGSVNDFLEYRWAPMLPRDLIAAHNRRRSVLFDVSNFADLREEDAHFCFLYVTNDSHVVGVSNNFKFCSMPGYEDDLCFSNLEQRIREDTSFTFISMDTAIEFEDHVQLFSNRKRGLEDSFEVIDNETPPQKRRSTKEKVMIRTQDPSTLVTLSAEQWQDIFRIVSERSVVQTINTGAVAVAGPIFDINKQVSSQPANLTPYPFKNQATPPLTFESRLAILPGPYSVIMALDRNSTSCASCAMGKSLVRDLFIGRSKDEKTIHRMTEKMEAMKEEDVKLRLRLQKTLAEYQATRQNSYHLEELLVQNQQLEEQLRTTENRMEDLRAENKEMKDKLASLENNEKQPPSLIEDQDRAILEFLKEGFQGVIQVNGRRLTVILEENYSTNPEVPEPKEEWKMYFPKRMERMRNSICNQSITIASLRDTVISQRTRMSSQSERMQNIQRKLELVTRKKKETDTKLAEVTQRIRCLLRDRAKCFTNEWRQFARKITVNPPREKEPRTRAITSVIRSPPALVSSSWKSRRPERKCETCGVVFSASVDPRVIEEHIAFHNTYHKKHD